MPIYVYKHPITKQEFEIIREIKDRDKPYVAEDGCECYRVFSSFGGGWRKDREIFEIDPDYVRKCNPKYIKFRDGHREKYDSNKHR